MGIYITVAYYLLSGDTLIGSRPTVRIFSLQSKIFGMELENGFNVH